jgi:hypothetical protein
MDFHTQLDDFIRSCKEYQKQVDDKGLHFQEPYQSIYLDLNKVLIIHVDEKLKLEAMAAGEQTAPGFANLTPARREYYELEAEVPSFLANGGTAYYYLQRYKIACTHLVKTFSYSTYKGDWEKMRHLGNWLGAIYGEQQKGDVKDSFRKSMEHLRDLRNVEHLSTKELQELEEEVRNIQALLIENPELKEKLTPEDAELIQEVAAYLETQQDLLKGLPELDDDFKFEEPPLVEVIIYRSKQLTILLDHFHEGYPDNPYITELSAFKQSLRDSFDLNVDICESIYNLMIGAMGSKKSIRIKELCTVLFQALNRFTDESVILNSYGSTLYVNHIVFTKGIPDTLDLEMLLMLAILEPDKDINEGSSSTDFIA